MNRLGIWLAAFVGVCIVETARSDDEPTWPWLEYQAEACRDFAGRKAGPSFSLSEASIQLAEAVGRQAVFLEKSGDYIEWELLGEADVVSIRFSLPLAEEDHTEPAEIVLYANDEILQRVTLPRKHLWVFGNDSNRSLPPAWTDHRIDPDLTPRKAWDTIIVKLQRSVTAGTVLRIGKDSRSATESVAINLIETESLPPEKTMPEGFVSITDFGAIPGDGNDDGAALAAALEKHRKIYLPPGDWDFIEPRTFEVTHHILQGSGIHSTKLQGWYARFIGTGSGCRFYDFSADGKARYRAQQGEGNHPEGYAMDRSQEFHFFDGVVGKDAVFENLHLSHYVVTFASHDPTSESLRIMNVRIRSSFAGGIVVRGGHVNARISHVHVRGSGDDGIVLWSSVPGRSKKPNKNCIIEHCTVESPWFANNLAIYGGTNNRISKCVARDNPTLSGLKITPQFDSSPFRGTTVVRDLTLIRCGNDGSGHGIETGSIQFATYDGANVTNVLIENCRILDPPHDAISVVRKKKPASVRVVLKHLKVDSPGRHVVSVGKQILNGEMQFEHPVIEGLSETAIKNESPGKLLITGLD
ncbi:right-handed parallel beta-helix repeat-containing protein [Verrucomicrobiales bacterium BCK34]|nr:right-handed parallel beta-helix repeat-containing protein [Verrucomicrobiales bacterium BCK34]